MPEDTRRQQDAKAEEAFEIQFSALALEWDVTALLEET
jgi:hypothetical protein